MSSVTRLILLTLTMTLTMTLTTTAAQCPSLSLYLPPPSALPITSFNGTDAKGPSLIFPFSASPHGPDILFLHSALPVLHIPSSARNYSSHPLSPPLTGTPDAIFHGLFAGGDAFWDVVVTTSSGVFLYPHIGFVPPPGTSPFAQGTALGNIFSPNPIGAYVPYVFPDGWGLVGLGIIGTSLYSWGERLDGPRTGDLIATDLSTPSGSSSNVLSISLGPVENPLPSLLRFSIYSSPFGTDFGLTLFAPNGAHLASVDTSDFIFSTGVSGQIDADETLDLLIFSPGSSLDELIIVHNPSPTDIPPPSEWDVVTLPPIASPKKVFLADLDGSGLDDLVVQVSTPNLMLLPSPLGSTLGPSALAAPKAFVGVDDVISAADLDGDSITDFVYGGNVVYGGPVNQAHWEITSISPPFAVALSMGNNVIDIDRDGHYDVIAGFNSGVALLFGGSLETYIPPLGVSQTKAMACVDLTGDAYPDLLIAGSGFPSSGVFLFPNSRTRPDPFNSATRQLIASIPHATVVDIWVADVGHSDDVLDVVVLVSSPLSLITLFGDPNEETRFSPTTPQHVYSIPELGGPGEMDNVGDMVLADFDGDHLWDALLSFGSGNVVFVPGTLASHAPPFATVGATPVVPALPPPHTSETCIHRSYVGDITGDGLPDLVTTMEECSPSETTPALSVFINLGNASSTLLGPGSHPLSGLEIASISNVVFGDFNSDDEMDLAVSIEDMGASYTRVLILYNDGSGLGGGKLPFIVINNNVHRSFLFAVDWNGDGITDLVAADMDASFFAPQWYLAVNSGSIFGPRRVKDVLLTPPMVSQGVFGSPSQSVATLHTSLLNAKCTTSVVKLAAPSASLVGCSVTSHLELPPGSAWEIEGDPDLPARVACGPQGGVLFAVGEGASLKLSHMSIVGGTVGESIDAATGFSVAGPSGTLTLDHVHITDFSTLISSPLQSFSGLGGSVSVGHLSTLVVTNSTFEGCSARVGGGAVALVGASARLVITHSRFIDNVAGGEDSGGGGGAIGVYAPAARVEVDASVMEGNVAARVGGALFLSSFAGGSRVVLNSTVLRGNSAHGGGALAVSLAPSSSGGGSQPPLVAVGASSSVVHSVAWAGGAVAVYERGSEPLPSGVSSLDLAEGPSGAVPLDWGHVVEVAAGAEFSGNTARYGSDVYACGASVGSLGGGGGALNGRDGFVCLSLDRVAPSWLDDLGLERVTSPPSRLDLVDVPESVVPGIGMGSGVAVLSDVFGTVVVDPLLSLSVSIPDAGVGAVVFPVTAQVPDDGNGGADLSGVVIAAAERVVGDGAERVSLRVVLDGPVGSQVLMRDVEVRVDACPLGWGGQPSGSEGGSTLVECAVCSAGLVSAGESPSIAPCVAPPGCPLNSLPLATNVSAGGQSGQGGGGQNGGGGGSVEDVLNCWCERGFYEQSPGAVSTELVCLPCPRGGLCAGGRARPTAAPGFFPESGESLLFLECPNEGACLEGGVCKEGYQGRLCAQCVPEHYALRGQCFECRTGVNVIVMVILVVVSLLMCGALVGFSLADGIRYKFAAAVIGISALQISAIYGRLELDWGDVGAVFFDIVSFANLNLELTSPECSVAPGTDVWVLKLALTLLLPVFAGVGIGAVSAVFAVGIHAGAGWLGRKTLSQLRWAALRAWFQALVLLYLPLSSAAFSVFGCRKDESGRWLLEADPTRTCFNSAWWSGLFPLGLVSVVVYAFALPLGVIVVLKRRQKLLDPVTFALRFGFLVGRFTESAWYFEAAIMGRKLLVVICMTFFFTQEGKANAAVFALLGTWGQLLYTRPYAALFHNVLATIVLAATIVVLLSGTFDDYELRRIGVIGGIAVVVLAIVVGNGIDLWRMGRREKEVEEEEYFQPGVVGMDADVVGMVGGGERDSIASDGFGSGGVELSLMSPQQ